MPFQDRADAGRRLVPRLLGLREHDPIVLGLARGGVPVGYEIAEALGAPLDVLLVRKIGVPRQPELAMGAIGELGVEVRNEHVVRTSGVTPAQFAEVVRRERIELDRRAHRFRGDREPVAIEGRVVVVVDDGLATGATARVALRTTRARHAAGTILAVPVAPPDMIAVLQDDADMVVAAELPAQMLAIGAWYDDFTQTSDEEVVDLLQRAAARVSR